MTEAPAQPGQRWLRTGLRWLLAIIYCAQWVGLAVVIAAMAPGIGMGTFPAVLALFVIAWFTLSCNGIALLGPTWPRIALAIMVPFFGIYALYQVEAGLIIDALVRNPPPKPMFHVLLQSDHELLPSWHQPCPSTDRANHVAIYDRGDNALLLLPNRESIRDINFGVDAMLIPVPGSTGPVAVRAYRNAMVVIGRDGSREDFGLPPFGAESVITGGLWDEDGDFLREALGWVMECDRGRLEEIIACDADRQP